MTFSIMSSRPIREKVFGNQRRVPTCGKVVDVQRIGGFDLKRTIGQFVDGPLGPDHRRDNGHGARLSLSVYFQSSVVGSVPQPPNGKEIFKLQGIDRSIVTC